MFIDGIYKIVKQLDNDDLIKLVAKLKEMSDKYNVDFVISANTNPAELPSEISDVLIGWFKIEYNLTYIKGLFFNSLFSMYGGGDMNKQAELATACTASSEAKRIASYLILHKVFLWKHKQRKSKPCK